MIVNPDNQASAPIGAQRGRGPTHQYKRAVVIGSRPSNRGVAPRPPLRLSYISGEVRPCGRCELSTLLCRELKEDKPLHSFFFVKNRLWNLHAPLSHHHEGCRIYLHPEDQGRRRGHGALPLRAELDHLQVQDPAAGRADERVPAGHEQLLQQAEGAGAHAAHQQEGEQGGDPAARHRLHLGPAGRARRAGEESPALRGQRAAHAAHHPQRRARQHRRGERMLGRQDYVPLKEPAWAPSSHGRAPRRTNKGEPMCRSTSA